MTRGKDWRPLVAKVIRFGLVGFANTAVYYLVYLLLLQFLPYLWAHTIAFACGVVFSFFANCLFTFKVRPTWRRFIEFPATTVINFVITTFGSVALVSWWGADTRWATLVASVVAIPFTFVATHFVLSRPRPDGQ